MVKKYIAKKDLDEAVKQAPSANDCPQCGVHFYGSTVARESHMKLYPQHFIAPLMHYDPTQKEAAVHEDLRGKVSHAKKEPKP